MPGLSSKYTEVIDELEIYISESNLASIFGILSKSNNEEGVSNSLMSLGKLNGKFDKQKLVPFGEYVPFTIFDSFFSFFKLYLKSVNSIDDDVRVSKRLYVASKRLRGFEPGKIGPVDGGDFIGGNYTTVLNAATTLPEFGANLENIDFQSTLGETPRNFALDPEGNFLLAANQDTSDIFTFKINKES